MMTLNTTLSVFVIVSNIALPCNSFTNKALVYLAALPHPPIFPLENLEKQLALR